MARLIAFGSGGSEGIPVPFCNCKVCRSGEKRRRSGYALEIGKTKIWLELSPEFREQITEYGRIPDYFFLSHLHYDHITGICDLRQALVVSGQEISFKLILPKHVYIRFLSFESIRDLVDETIYSAFWDLVNSKRVKPIVLGNLEWFYLQDNLKIVLINNVHGNVMSSSLAILGKKNFLYLADASTLNDYIYELNKEYEFDLVLAHTPHIHKMRDHIGVEDLLKLNTKKIVLSHISHKVQKTHKEIKEEIRKIDKKFDVAYDGMVVEF